jgi:hypothetical protein
VVQAHQSKKKLVFKGLRIENKADEKNIDYLIKIKKPKWIQLESQSIQKRSEARGQQKPKKTEF